jgi:hypothetical protein
MNKYVYIAKIKEKWEEEKREKQEKNRQTFIKKCGFFGRE